MGTIDVQYRNLKSLRSQNTAGIAAAESKITVEHFTKVEGGIFGFY